MTTALELARQLNMFVGAIWIVVAICIQVNPWRHWRPSVWVAFYALGVAQMASSSVVLFSAGGFAPLVTAIGAVMFAVIGGVGVTWLVFGSEPVAEYHGQGD
ncbi:hypothetical protein ACFPYI_01970 [Halomarina salina]|uniref:Uncharacterized protein n=1 Tax=Halomarina salina TaxID=1872699 RepID=A0ABD5RIA7_9EURY|nr:hypothetical protein [Halomarina salina]